MGTLGTKTAVGLESNVEFLELVPDEAQVDILVMSQTNSIERYTGQLQLI